MNTLALVTLLVNQTMAWSEPDAGLRFLDLGSHVHGLIGSLIVVIAVLIVATAERQWRSRITSASVITRYGPSLLTFTTSCGARISVPKRLAWATARRARSFPLKPEGKPR